MTVWDAMVMLSRMTVTFRKELERRASPKPSLESKSKVSVNIDQR